MQQGLAEMGIIEGENAVRRFKKLCGEDPNPLKCGENPLRKTFGKEEPKFYQGQIFFLNGVHKSADKRNSITEIKLFHSLAK